MSTRHSNGTVQIAYSPISTALLTLIVVGLYVSASTGLNILMPGPLSSEHAAIAECKQCHANAGHSKLGWLRGVISQSREADSSACLACHRIEEDRFAAHNASPARLLASTNRLKSVAASMTFRETKSWQAVSLSWLQRSNQTLICATCHKEHKGASGKRSALTDSQCQSCHVLKLTSFKEDHPAFENYGFKRRTRIIYDHAAHIDKHFPELTKKDSTHSIPTTCVACHVSSGDKEIMGVKPFEQACGGCHLDEIRGKQRVAGPKGIAFLSIPGLDLKTLKEKNAPIGEWPTDSDAALTPFMKLMISRSEKGRATIASVERLNLQDLGTATAQQINAVTALAREIKSLLSELISKKPAAVLSDAETPGDLVSDLMADFPREIVLAAQRQWLPNLSAEITNGPGARIEPAAEAEAPAAQNANDDQSRKSSTLSSSEKNGSSMDEKPATPSPQARSATAPKRSSPPCLVRMLGQCLVSKGTDENTGNAAPAENSSLPQDTQPPPRPAIKLPPAMRAGLSDIRPPKTETSKAPPIDRQEDELLFPSQQEIQEIDAHRKGLKPRTAPSDGVAMPDQATEPTIESNLDAETWADHGGWYRQDWTIYYRPAAHKDRFLSSWLNFTAPLADVAGHPALSVFQSVTGKEAPGACTKCHSVDSSPQNGKTVKFAPLKSPDKKSSFTRFRHEPHLSQMGDRGCLSCHDLARTQPYLKTYDQEDPLRFTSAFAAIKKSTCESCHNPNQARQDCLLCHRYHVNGVGMESSSTP